MIAATKPATGALLHVLGHALMKGCLFLAAGGVIWTGRTASVHGVSGLSGRLPWTTAGFTLAAISMIGLPPTVGFFSKWYLLLGAAEAGAWTYVLVLVASSLLTAVYFFRLIERAYFQPPPPEHEGEPALELPAAMRWPVLVMSAGVLLVGVFNQRIVSTVIAFALPDL